MAIYKKGTASLAADGTVTGTGTSWKSALSLIRVGSTIVFTGTNPLVIANISDIVSDTELRITTPGETAANGSYAILLSDALSVDGLAQDVAETLRYYQGKETEIAAIIEKIDSTDFDDLVNQMDQILAEAKQQAQASSDSSDLSKRWASDPEDSEVADGLFSSLHYSRKSALSADESQGSANLSEQSRQDSVTAAQASADSAVESERSNKASAESAEAAKQSADNAKASEDQIEYALSGALRYRGNMESGSSANSLNAADSAGVWQIPESVAASVSGIPVNAEAEIQVGKLGETGIIQRFIATGSRRFFLRSFTNGAWSSWVEFASVNTNGITSTIRGFSNQITLPVDAGNPTEAVTLRQMQQAISAVSSSGGINGVMSNYVGAITWWTGNPANLPTGNVGLNGQLVKRSDYPEVWALINASVLIAVSDSDWQAAENRAYFSTGDGSTTFRFPDLNGAVSGSIGGLFLRGSGAPSDAGSKLGITRESAAPNITGSYAAGGAVGVVNKANSTLTGAFVAGSQDKDYGWPYQNKNPNSPNAGASPVMTNTPLVSNDFNFSASLSNPAYGRNGASEVRPSSVTGVWIMRVNGTFSANTSFNVMVSAAAEPGGGVVVYGGDVRSVYIAGGKSLAAGRMRVKITGGSTPVKKLTLGLEDGNTVKEWVMPDDSGEVSVIVDYGSNSNGNYIKYSDGTMICYLKVRNKSISSSPRTEGSISFYTTVDLWVLPAEFYDSDFTCYGSAVMLATNGVSAGLFTTVSFSTDSKSSVNVRYSSGIQIGSIQEASIFAIGRWKK